MPIHLAKWSNQDWTCDRIDRFFHRQNFRLAAGIQIEAGFSGLHGALAVYQGRGKYLRLKDFAQVSLELTPAVQKQCRDVMEDNSRSADSVATLAADLVEFQSVLVDKILRMAGKYFDRVLAVTLDPLGLKHLDFDGKPNCVSFYDAVRLAEKTGANIIDAIPERDFVAGGNGIFLEALPCWLIHAERELSHEQECKLLILIGEFIELFLLPPSDGSDEFVPDIRAQRLNASDERGKPESLTAMAPAILEFVKSNTRLGVVAETIVIGAKTDVERVHHVLNSEKMPCYGRIASRDEFQSISSYRALIAATWGILFADQMPGNLPELTGAKSQRILGRVTPGKPVVWRNLLLNMNDGVWPIMRLRDAV